MLDGEVRVAASPIVLARIGPHGKEQQFPRETLEYLTRRAEPYASEAGVGGSTDFVRSFIKLEGGKQDYDVYADLIIPGPNGEELKLEEFDGSDGHLSVFNPKFASSLPANVAPSKIKIQEVKKVTIYPKRGVICGYEVKLESVSQTKCCVC